MNGLLAVVLTVLAAGTAIAVYEVQVRLEAWDRRRHADD